MDLAIFDIDGTLTQTMGLTDDLFVRTVSEILAVDLGAQDWTSFPHVTDSAVLEHLCTTHCRRLPTDVERASIRARYMAAMRLACSTARPVAGAVEALQQIQTSQRWNVAIATGNWYEAACHKLEVCGIAPEGMPMATADDAHDRTKIVMTALSRAGSADRVVYFGDREWDRKAAEALGIGFVAVGRHVPLSPIQVDDFTDIEAVWNAMELAARPWTGGAPSWNSAPPSPGAGPVRAH